jgi:hypothetical protein
LIGSDVGSNILVYATFDERPDWLSRRCWLIPIILWINVCIYFYLWIIINYDFGECRQVWISCSSQQSFIICFQFLSNPFYNTMRTIYRRKIHRTFTYKCINAHRNDFHVEIWMTNKLVFQTYAAIFKKVFFTYLCSTRHQT